MTDTRSLILDTAARLFAEQGYVAISMRDVARAAGMTQANLYYHFRDKDQMINDTLAHLFASRIASLDEVLETHLADGDELERFVRWMVKLLAEDIVFARLLHRELLDGDAGRLANLAQAIFLRPFTLFTEIVSAQGRRSDPRPLALSAIALIIGQILVLPLMPLLAGNAYDVNNPDPMVTQILAMLRPALSEQS